MSDMIERVAMAVAKLDGFEWDGMKRTTSGAVARDMYRVRARAAIEAMREPTTAMLMRGGIEDGFGTARIVWADMLEEALK